MDSRAHTRGGCSVWPLPPSLPLADGACVACKFGCERLLSTRSRRARCSEAVVGIYGTSRSNCAARHPDILRLTEACAERSTPNPRQSSGSVFAFRVIGGSLRARQPWRIFACSSKPSLAHTTNAMWNTTPLPAMKESRAQVVSALAIALVAAAATYSGSTASAELRAYDDLVSQARRCGANDRCVVAGGVKGCRCAVPVRAEERGRVDDAAHVSQCAQVERLYCPQLSAPRCEKGLCTADESHE